MDSEKLKIQIGANISQLRKKEGLTQAELAEKLNYTDKAVSKWERGESVPDVITLAQISELFQISLDDLVGSQPSRRKLLDKPKEVLRKSKKGSIVALSSLLVWFIALTVYVVLSSVGFYKTWVVLVYAVPVNAIVLLSLRSAFRQFSWNHVLVSLIVWGCLLSVHVTLWVFAGINVWRVFLLGLLGQAAVSLWFRMLRVSKEEPDGQD